MLQSILSYFAITDTIAWTILILAAAAFIQTTMGFAAALFGLPLLLWVGNDLMSAQILMITAMLPQNLFAVWVLRKNIKLNEVLVPAAIRIATLPIGIAGLAVVVTWSPARINQLVGAIILVAVIVQAFVGIEWKSAKRWYWVLITFGGSGILQGLSGMSGPPLILWVHGQRYSADRARAFLFSLYISNFVPQILLLWWQFGDAVLQAMEIAVLSLPFVLLSAMLGLRLGSWLGDRWLRPLTYACLIWLAASSLLEPWLREYIYPWFESIITSTK